MSAIALRPGALIFWSTFAAVAAVLYVFAMELNWAAFTYHPRLVEFGLGAERPRSGPAMYWYGWIATSIGGGLAAGAIGAMAARAVPADIWLRIGCVLPAVAMLAALYFMIPFFTK